MLSSVKHFLLLAAIAVAVTGCGIRPGQLDAPQGEDKDAFPHVYPQPRHPA
jgi:predicted small lipoprotein YifL